MMFHWKTRIYQNNWQENENLEFRKSQKLRKKETSCVLRGFLGHREKARAALKFLKNVPFTQKSGDERIAGTPGTPEGPFRIRSDAGGIEPVLVACRVRSTHKAKRRAP